MTRPKDHLIAAAVSEIARLGAECGTHQSFRQRVSQIVVPLVDGLNENLTAANARLMSLELDLAHAHAAAEANVRDAERRITELENVLRELASSLGAGGHNAPSVNATEFEAKIRWGIDEYAKMAVALACKERDARVAELESELAATRELARRWY